MSDRVAQLRRRLERRAGRLVFPSVGWLRHCVAELAPAFANKRVLEIGSGRTDHGADMYSMRALFPDTAEFTTSDANPAFRHLVLDITTMDLDSEYDLILCCSVIEHVPEFWKAIPRLHRALRPGGTLVLSTPMIYPYHDEPADYYRFTAHGLRSLLREFSEVQVRHRGLRRLPFGVLAVAQK